MAFELSEYQKNIVDFFRANPGKNILVNALAGCSKTYTITKLTEGTTTSDVYLAFNTAIAEECRGKIKNPKTKIYTTYSLGLQIMNYNLNNADGGWGQTTTNSAGSGKKADLDNLKIHKIVDEMISNAYGRKLDWEERMFLKNNYVSLYQKVRCGMCVHNQDTVEKIIKDHYLFVDIENGYEAPDNSVIFAWIQEIDSKSLEEFEKFQTIDFTDMVYITVSKMQKGEWKPAPWQYYTNIYTDECVVGNTLVKTETGVISIEELYDKFCKKESLPHVKSFHISRRETEYSPIEKATYMGEKEVFRVETEGGIVLEATSNHLFLTEYGYYELKELAVGDMLVCDDYDSSYVIGHTHYDKIKSITPCGTKVVYDISVLFNHNFTCYSPESNGTNGIVVHNCQDLNQMQFDMLRFIKRKNGRYVFVGDENQAIFAFNLSRTDCMDYIRRSFTPIKEFDLPINYRCPETHLSYVRGHYNIPIQARPDAPKGNIKYIDKTQIKKFVEAGDMIISRKNKWLSNLLIDLAISGIPVYIEDKEMVDSIKKLIKAQKLSTCTGLKNKFTSSIRDVENKIAKMIEDNKTSETPLNQVELEQNIHLLNYKLGNIRFADSLLSPYMTRNKNASTDEFLTYLDKILNTVFTKDCVRICSVHKAKGLEARQVFVLNEAKVCRDFRNSPEQQQQEINLAYISVTRATETLYLVREGDE